MLEAYKRKWPAFVSALAGPGPLGVSHESAEPGTDDFWAHNTIVSYAYVLALTACDKHEVSVLDWGGGIGHYYVISKSVVPGVAIDYHCKDVPLLCAHGRSLFPEARFYDDESCLERRYDLVLASGSLQYSEDWRRTLEKLGAAAGTFLYVTRLPTVRESRSFVVLQRAYSYGYDTEYLGWALNREELLAAAGGFGLELAREFLLSDAPFVYAGAPEHADERGFLFRPSP